MSIHITHDQLVAWAGRPLTSDEVGCIERATPHSSIPEVIATLATIAANLPAGGNGATG